MITQFAPIMQKPEDSVYDIFDDTTLSKNREMNSDPPTDSSGADLVLPKSFLIFSISPKANVVYYGLVMVANSGLELDIRDRMQNWLVMLNADYPSRSTGSVALEAVEYIKTLLGMSEIKVADLVDISRNTIRNWRNGQGAYPSTVRKLFQVKHLISALDSTMTQNQLSGWLNGEDDNDPRLSRLDRLAQPDGPALVARQASSFLFPPPPGNLPPPAVLHRELERIELEEKGWMEDEDTPRQYSARPRRQRPAQGADR